MSKLQLEFVSVLSLSDLKEQDESCSFCDILAWYHLERFTSSFLELRPCSYEQLPSLEKYSIKTVVSQVPMSPFSKCTLFRYKSYVGVKASISKLYFLIPGIAWWYMHFLVATCPCTMVRLGCMSHYHCRKKYLVRTTRRVVNAVSVRPCKIYVPLCIACRSSGSVNCIFSSIIPAWDRIVKWYFWSTYTLPSNKSSIHISKVLFHYIAGTEGPTPPTSLSWRIPGDINVLPWEWYMQASPIS